MGLVSMWQFPIGQVIMGRISIGLVAVRQFAKWQLSMGFDNWGQVAVGWVAMRLLTAGEFAIGRVDMMLVIGRQFVMEMGAAVFLSSVSFVVDPTHAMKWSASLGTTVGKKDMTHEMWIFWWILCASGVSQDFIYKDG